MNKEEAVNLRLVLWLNNLYKNSNTCILNFGVGNSNNNGAKQIRVGARWKWKEGESGKEN